MLLKNHFISNRFKVKRKNIYKLFMTLRAGKKIKPRILKNLRKNHIQLKQGLYNFMDVREIKSKDIFPIPVYLIQGLPVFLKNLELQGILSQEDVRWHTHFLEYLYYLYYYYSQRFTNNRNTEFIALSEEKFYQFAKMNVPENLRLRDLNIPCPALIMLDNGENFILIQEEECANSDPKVTDKIAHCYFNGEFIFFNLSLKRIVNLKNMKNIYPRSQKSPDIIYEDIETVGDFLKELDIDFNFNYQLFDDNIKQQGKVNNNILIALINILGYLSAENVKHVKTEFNPKINDLTENTKDKKFKKFKKDKKDKKKIEKKISGYEELRFVTIDNSKTVFSPSDGSGSKIVESHWRQSHWHTYWVGPKKEPEKRKTVLKYIPDIFVGSGDKEQKDKPMKVGVIKDHD